MVEYQILKLNDVASSLIRLFVNSPKLELHHLNFTLKHTSIKQL